MNQTFIEILKNFFPNQFEIKMEKNDKFISFPAKSSDFGNIEIYEESPVEYIVSLGHFTHSHFDCYDGTEEEQIKMAAEDISSFLKSVFADCIICHGSHKGGGGWHIKGDNENFETIDDYFVWSGAYKH